jgi:hypothetical protein
MKRLAISTCIAAYFILLTGCDPVLCTIRAHPVIEDEEHRVLSFQLRVPGCDGPPNVVSYGVFTAALLENSTDTLDDFDLGTVRPCEIEDGNVSLAVQESGETRKFVLHRADDRWPRTLHLELFVPRDLDEMTTAWSAEPPPNREDADEN